MAVLNILLCFSVCILTVLGLDKQNYYWEEYSGRLPPNAVPAGAGLNGKLYYIGKTSAYGKEIPGYMESPGTNEQLYIAYNKQPKLVKEKIKILCAEFPEQMEWITVNHHTFRHMSNRNVVMGGSYDSEHGEFPYLVGRKNISGTIIVGGVTTSEFEMELIAAHNSGVKGINVKEGIDILSYNPYLPKNNGEKSLKPGSGYYWQDYEGFIPTDAVPGGTAYDGSSTYIGQVYYNDSIICGELDPVKKSLSFVQNNVAHKFHINIKILCAHHPKQMEWIDVNKRNYWFLWQNNLVIGGQYGLYPLLIGRKSYTNRVIVGSAPRHGYNSELRIVFENAATTVETFQVLTYNPFIPINEKQDSQNNKNPDLVLKGKSTGNIYYLHFYK